MPNKFSWFPKFTATLEKVPEEQRAVLAWAIIQYGTNGVAPDFGGDWALEAAFTSLKEDIDNSVVSSNGNRGGRPRKDGSKPRSAAKKVSAPSEKPVVGNPETGVSDNGNGGFGGTETGVSHKGNPYHSTPSQDIPFQANEEGQFDPPTIEEVRGYFGANCLRGDPDDFWAHYQSQGWAKTSGMPVTDWHAAALQWGNRQKQIDAERKSAGKQTSQEIGRSAVWKPAESDEDEVARLERMYAEAGGEL